MFIDFNNFSAQNEPLPSNSLKERIIQCVLSIASKIKTFVKEFFAVLTFALLYPFGWITSGSCISKKNREKPPVIFVHGILHNLSGSYPLNSYLRKKGWTHLYALNLGNPFTNSIDTYTKKLEKFVEKVREETGSEKVILIGHSMGGFVSTNYALAPENQDKVSKLVTLGSPLKGTVLAHLGKDILPCVRDFLPLSPRVQHIQNLAKDNLVVPMLCIGTKSDALIIPTKNTFLEGPMVSNHQVIEEGHISLILSGKVFRLLNTFIS